MRILGLRGWMLSGCTALAGCFGSSSGGPSPSATFDSGFDTGADATSASDAGTPETGATEASASDATTAEASAPWPDAGAGCNPPTGTPGLSATAEGLPANGLVLWLRGDRGVYTVADDAGSDDAAAGPSVCAWADQSGNGWLLTGQPSALPTLSPSGIGGQAAIVLGSGTTLQTSGVLGIAPTSPRTFVAVETLVGESGRFDPILQGEQGSAGTYLSIDANTWQTVGNAEGVYMPQNSIQASTATSAGAARVHVYTISSMVIGTAFASAIDYRVNGVTQTLTVREGGGTVQDFTGANFTAVDPVVASSTGAPPSGMVAEVLVYDRALSVAERATVEGVLEARYGIP